MQRISIEKGLLRPILILTLSGVSLLAIITSRVQLRQFEQVMELSTATNVSLHSSLKDTTTEALEALKVESYAGLKTKGETLVSRDSLALAIALSHNSTSSIRKFLTRSVEMDPDIIEASFYVKNGDRVDLWQFASKDLPEGVPLGATYDPLTKEWKTASKAFSDPNLASLFQSKGSVTRVLIRGDSRYLEVATYVESDTGKRGYLRYLLTTANLDKTLASMQEQHQTSADQVKLQSQSFLTSLRKEQAKSTFALGIVFVGFLLLGAFSAIVLAKRLAHSLTRPLEKLKADIARFAAGDYESAISVKSEGEIGTLARECDSMRVLVRERTHELMRLANQRQDLLTAALHETSAIVNIVDTGIMMILACDENPIIAPNMSPTINEIFKRSRQKLASTPAYDVLIEPAMTLSSETKKVIRNALFSCVGVDKLNFEANQMHLPREITLAIEGEERMLKLDWRPLTSNRMVYGLLVAIDDVTEAILVQKQVRLALEEQNRTLEGIASAVKHPQQRSLVIEVARLTCSYREYADLISRRIGWTNSEKGNNLTSVIFKEISLFRTTLIENGIEIDEISVDDKVINWAESALPELRVILSNLMGNIIHDGYLHPLACGEKRRGTIKFRAFRDGGSMVKLMVEHGGAGYNVQAIRASAHLMGLDPDSYRNPLDLLLLPEFSTPDQVVPVLGAGSLFVMKTVVDSFNGLVELENRENGRGRRITISLPSRLVSSSGPVNEKAA